MGLETAPFLLLPLALSAGLDLDVLDPAHGCVDRLDGAQ